MVYPALLPLMRTPRLPVVDWTDATADLNGLVRFAERRNRISVRVPSHFNWLLPDISPTQSRSQCASPAYTWITSRSASGDADDGRGYQLPAYYHIPLLPPLANRQTAQSSCHWTQTTLRGYRYQHPPQQNGQTTAGVSKPFTNHYDVAIRDTIYYYYAQFAPRFCNSSYGVRTNGVHLRHLPLSSLGLPPRSGIWFIPAFLKKRTASICRVTELASHGLWSIWKARNLRCTVANQSPSPLGNCNRPEFPQTFLHWRYTSCS